MENVELVEVVWTLVAFVGLVAATYNVVQAAGDRAAMRRERSNGYARALLGFTLAQEALRLVAETLFIGIGLYAMALPPLPPDDRGSPAVIIGLVLANGVISANSCMTVYTRRKLGALVNQQQRRLHDGKGE